GGAVPSFDCPIVSILPKKPDATVIRRNMDAESGWEPRRGAFRVPKALAEGGGDSMSVEENLRVIEAAQKALNDRDLDRFETLHLNSVVQRDPQNPQGIKGRSEERRVGKECRGGWWAEEVKKK